MLYATVDHVYYCWSCDPTCRDRKIVDLAKTVVIEADFTFFSISSSHLMLKLVYWRKWKVPVMMSQCITWCQVKNLFEMAQANKPTSQQSSSLMRLTQCVVLIVMENMMYYENKTSFLPQVEGIWLSWLLKWDYCLSGTGIDNIGVRGNKSPMITGLHH